MKKNARRKGAAEPERQPSPHHLPEKQQGVLIKIYNRLPLLPFLDRSTSAIAYACISGYLLFMLYVFLAMPPVQLTSSITESSISKNSQLMLLAGETYTYEISGPVVEGLRKRVTYAVRSASSCPGILLTEQVSDFVSSECLSRATGNAISDPLQLNSSTGNQSFLIFSPWMLAVSDSFSWQAASKAYAAGLEMSFTTQLRSLGKKQAAGRQAYEISVSSPVLGSKSTYFIDAEKRVLLSAESGNLTVKLVSAPFPLNWTSAAKTSAN